MRIDLTLLAVSVLLLAAQPASACQCTGEHTPLSSASVVFAGLDAAWNDRDAERFGAVFTDDVSFQFVDQGEGFEGRAALTGSFAERFPTFPAELRHATAIRVANSISPGVLAVDGDVEILRVNEGGQASVFRSFAIFALVEEAADGCRVRLIRIWQLPAQSG